MSIMGGEGNFVVFGYAAPERDSNQGLRRHQQDTKARKGDIEIYRTNNEDEARRLTVEGAVEYQGTMYVTTHYADSGAAAAKDHAGQVTGTLRKDDPTL